MAVAGAGDSNGDGLADLVVGASAADPGGVDAGSARIVAICGAEIYGVASGPLGFGWQPDAPRGSAGRLLIRDGTPAGAAGLGVGLGEANVRLASLTLLIDTSPAAGSSCRSRSTAAGAPASRSISATRRWPTLSCMRRP